MRIGLLISRTLSKYRYKTLLPILKDKNFSIIVSIIDNRSSKSLLAKVKEQIRRGRGGYIAVMGLQSIFFNKEETLDTISFCNKNGIDTIKTKAPYSKQTAEKIKNYDLDVLLLVGGYGIIQEPLLSVAPQGILSYHHGNMRTYRGKPPAFWELYNNEVQMGVTVQKLSADLDSGTPIVEREIRIRQNDTYKTLKERAYTKSEGMMYQALLNIKDHEFKPTHIEKFGTIYTLPNFRQWFALKAKVVFKKIKNYLL